MHTRHATQTYVRQTMVEQETEQNEEEEASNFTWGTMGTANNCWIYWFE